MVNIATAFGRSGLQEWLIQRITAVILGLYTIYLLAFCFCHPDFSYVTWLDLFESAWMQTVSFCVLLALIAHAWIGIWTVATDYIKPVAIRLPFLVIVNLGFLIYLIWGIKILWGF